MNELLQKHGCSNVFTIPEGLRELMADITREVLREQPKNMYNFISNYLSALLLTREHGVMAVKILEDLCDCRPSVSEHLLHLGLEKNHATFLAQIIKDEIEKADTSAEKECLKETDILKKMLTTVPLDEEMAAQVVQVLRNAYKDYVYKKKLMEQDTTIRGNEPWQLAAERTLMMYKKTKPSLNELHRATERIQAAYKGYYVRKNLLKHLKPKKRGGPKQNPLGAPLDIAGSREINLGPVINFRVFEDDVNAMFEEHATAKLGLKYDPKLMLAHEDNATDVPSPYSKTMKTEVHMIHVESELRDSNDSSQVHGIMRRDCIEREVDNYNDDQSDTYFTDHRTVGTPARMISFSTMPPELIPTAYLEDDGDQEVQEAIQEVLDDNNASQEIPEDILDDVLGCMDGTPAPSVSSLSDADLDVDDK